jgi:hypothetical protein
MGDEQLFAHFPQSRIEAKALELLYLKTMKIWTGRVQEIVVLVWDNR